ncbi:MAG: DoxX family membrane protein [bacterium]|nr:DoxX family membrane protein [bacterium]
MNIFFNYNFLIRFGLGFIFLANALMAFFAPSEFIELIMNSFVSNLLPIRPEIFVPIVVGINDTVVGLLLISGIATRRVAIWAMIWLIGVMVIIGSPLDVLEHFGLLFMPLALILGDKYLTKNI